MDYPSTREEAKKTGRSTISLDNPANMGMLHCAKPKERVLNV